MKAVYSLIKKDNQRILQKTYDCLQVIWKKKNNNSIVRNLTVTNQIFVGPRP